MAVLSTLAGWWFLGVDVHALGEWGDIDWAILIKTGIWTSKWFDVLSIKNPNSLFQLDGIRQIFLYYILAFPERFLTLAIYCWISQVDWIHILNVSHFILLKFFENHNHIWGSTNCWLRILSVSFPLLIILPFSLFIHGSY